MSKVLTVVFFAEDGISRELNLVPLRNSWRVLSGLSGPTPGGRISRNSRQLCPLPSANTLAVLPTTPPAFLVLQHRKPVSHPRLLESRDNVGPLAPGRPFAQPYHQGGARNRASSPARRSELRAQHQDLERPASAYVCLKLQVPSPPPVRRQSIA